MTIDYRREREPYALEYLHPVMQRPVHLLTLGLRDIRFEQGGKKFVLVPFEGFRHPARQEHLFAGGEVTKARPWESAHQYGLAVDFAGRWIDDDDRIGGWFWASPDHAAWRELKRRAAIDGLEVPISWDHGHVQHPLFAEVKRAYQKREWNWIA